MLNGIAFTARMFGIQLTPNHYQRGITFDVMIAKLLLFFGCFFFYKNVHVILILVLVIVRLSTNLNDVEVVLCSFSVLYVPWKSFTPPVIMSSMSSSTNQPISCETPPGTSWTVTLSLPASSSSRVPSSQTPSLPSRRSSTPRTTWP